MRCFVGLDDTDSQFGHCTTHLGFRAVEELLRSGATFKTYPRLVRLNPNVPFKTRGNAAVCLEFESDDPEAAFEVVETTLRRLSDVENGANSGLVFLSGRRDAEYFRMLYFSALSGLVNHRRVSKELEARNVRHHTLGNGMGLVGAAASLGFSPEDDHTYEFIAYRQEASCGTARAVDSASVKAMELTTFPHTFNSYDHASERVLITPHGPDPVFLGIRADSPVVAREAFDALRFREKLSGHMVYLSNQCTDAHLSSGLTMPMKAYSSGWLQGRVRASSTGPGGHAYVDLEVDGTTVHSAVYRPAADLRRAASLLEPGDLVRIYGGVRRGTSAHPPILNVEKVQVLALSGRKRWTNPVCANCNRVTKSEGRGKGFQCRKCGAKFAESSRLQERRQRSISPGIYLPSSGSQRHLTKPLARYGRELHTAHRLIEGWFSSESSPELSQNPRLGPRDLLSPRTP